MISVDWLAAPTNVEFAEVASLVSDFWREVIPGEPDWPAAELAAEVANVPAHRRMHLAVATDHAGLAGATALLLEDIEGRRHDGYISFFVVRPRRRRAGCGRAMLDAVVARAAAEGRTRLSGFTSLTHPPARAFAEASGAKPALVDRQNRMVVGTLDREMLETWVRRARQRAADYALLSFDGVCPDEWLERFAAVTAVMNTAPRSESAEDVAVTAAQARAQQEALVRQGYEGWTICALHQPTGQLAGYTELALSPYRPWLAIQGDTAVDPAHRNLGLGRWMKAVNALRLLDQHPEVTHVDTWNADVNAPMLGINDAMGFRPVAEWQDWELVL